MSTATTMENLFNKEEVLELNLKNITYEIKIYLKQISELFQQENIQDYLEKATWYQTVFKYYVKDLIPALEESAAMEEKHLELMNRNPDTQYRPIKMQIDCHQHIINTFIVRFQDIHETYYEFITNAIFDLQEINK